MTKMLSKILIMLLTIVILSNMYANSVYAAITINIDRALIQTIGYAEDHLKYYRENSGKYTYHKTILAGYKGEDGMTYPVYCMNIKLPGADEGEYYVTTGNILKNDAIWRIIKNGYPFKTAKEWGLSDEKDVYAITRFAIYIILGQEKLEYFKAEEDDKEAVAMLEALNKLVDIGRNGTEKQNDNPLFAEKVGGLTEKGEYYYQEYKVKSTAVFNKYGIENVFGMPNGAYIANSAGEEKNTFSSNEDFFVMIPKTELKNNIDIDITIGAECKVYLVLEGKTTIAGKQDYAVTVGEQSKAETTVNLKQNVNTGKIKINKIDKETKKPIKGVEFKLLDEKGKEILVKETDSKGVVIFENLTQGKYTLIETRTNENYEISSEEIKVDVEYNKEKVIDIENEHKKGNLKVYKVDKDNNSILLGSVKFDLYSEEDGKIVKSFVTDENGEAYIENLRTGKYKIIEKSTNKWYNLADEINIEIKENETTETKVENELKKGQVKVIKVDSENKEIKIEGVVFNVLDKDKNVLETITTDKNGEAKTSKYIVRDYDKIYLQEVSTNDKYILNDKIIEVELTENKIEEITIENEKIKGQIKIIKTSKDDNKVTGEKAGTPLKGVEFEIYDSNNKLVQKLTTDKSGTAITSKLEKGEYKIKEVLTNEWYYINQKTFSVNINQNNEIVNVNIENESKNPDISTEKVGMDRVEVGKEIEYDISMKNSGNTSLEGFYWIDTIPTEYITATKFKTGTYNQNIKYNLYYKTNLSNDEYILLMEDLKSSENYEIDFNKELADNEYVTEIKLDFGNVDVGFCSNENPHLLAKTKSNLKSETTFINTAKVYGTYNGYNVTDDSSWKTQVYKLLPKTGF